MKISSEYDNFNRTMGTILKADPKERNPMKFQ